MGDGRLGGERAEFGERIWRIMSRVWTTGMEYMETPRTGEKERWVDLTRIKVIGMVYGERRMM